MASPHAIPVAFADRPWCNLGEAMGFLMISDYNTFVKSFPGLKPWKEIGRKKYYLKEQLFNYVRDNGDDPVENTKDIPRKQHVKQLFR